ncbi:hypothetical protein [Rodentibacter haemolyticus]|uniref:GGDEF domain-containing protein n=1 Tax=Rodentibacter haemolyticus TaxID=2778911 RepID=A0ABX6UY68_9PAST|nr:hypothetical protein [Rodentibacter haemolyticus]QPB43045.1 hypothetical protein IHV77_02705 [Rodentibacter haemolyticus]
MKFDELNIAQSLELMAQRLDRLERVLGLSADMPVQADIPAQVLPTEGRLLEDNLRELIRILDSAFGVLPAQTRQALIENLNMQLSRHYKSGRIERADKLIDVFHSFLPSVHLQIADELNTIRKSALRERLARLREVSKTHNAVEQTLITDDK